MLTMLRVALVSVSLAGAGHGHRTQMTHERRQGSLDIQHHILHETQSNKLAGKLNSLNALSKLLLLFDQPAGWQIDNAVWASSFTMKRNRLLGSSQKVPNQLAAASVDTHVLKNSPARHIAPAVMDENKVDRKAQDGDEVVILYTAKLEDGTVFQDNQEATISVGAGEVLPGVETALRNMTIQEQKVLTLPPEQAFGERDETLVKKYPLGMLPEGTQEGSTLMIGQRQVLVAGIEEGYALLDTNHPLAGKTVIFELDLLNILPAPGRGLDMVGWGGKSVHVPIALTDAPVSKVFETPSWPSAWPYSPANFRRNDESDDEYFYGEPRFVEHIDKGAIGAIKKFYEIQFAQAPQGEYSVLDLCSSWISHYPEDLQAKRVAITGMVQKELEANKQATEYIMKNLNVDTKLPYGDNEFDFITNVVSVDYLNKPQEIFKEMHRVLKTGGVAIMSFSNRCFWTKAIDMWVQDMNDGPGHCQIIGNYFHFSPEGGWRDIYSADISPSSRTNPMWVVTAVKA